MAGPGWISVGALAASASAATLTPALPSPLSSPGGLLIAVCISKNNATHATATTGWTKIDQQHSGASFTMSWFKAQVGAAAPVVTWTGAVACEAKVTCYGPDPISAVGLTLGNTTFSTGAASPCTSASINTTANDSLVIYLTGIAANSNLAGPTGGWTENSDTNSATSATGLIDGSKPVATSGSASGAISVVASASAAWVQVQIELKLQAPASGIEASDMEVGVWTEPPNGLAVSEMEVGAWADPPLRISKSVAYVRFASVHVEIAKAYNLVRFTTNPLELRPPRIENVSHAGPSGELFTQAGNILTTQSGHSLLLNPNYSITFTGGPVFAGQTISPPRINTGALNFAPSLQRMKKNGNVDPGDTVGSSTANFKYATQVTLENGSVVALAAYSSAAGGFNSRMAIYADSAGEPGALLGFTSTLTSVVLGYNTYPLLTPFSVTAGPYWLAVHSDGDFATLLIRGSNTSRTNADIFSDGIANPFGTSTTVHNKAPVYAVQFEPSTISLRPPIKTYTSTLLAPTLVVGPVTLSPPRIASTAVLYPPTFPLAALYPPRIESTASLHAPSLAVGPVTIAPPRISDGDTLYPPTLAPGAVTLSPPRISDGDTLYPGTLVPGPVSLAPPRITDGDTLYPGTLVPGPVSLAPPRISDADTLYSPTLVVGPVTLSPPLISDGDTLYPGTLVPGPIDWTPPLIDEQDDVLYPPSLIPGPVTLRPPRIASTNVFPPKTFVPGPVDIDPPLLANVSTIYPGTLVPGPIDWDVPKITDTSTLFGPTFVPGPVDLHPPLLADDDTLYPPVFDPAGLPTSYGTIIT